MKIVVLSAGTGSYYCGSCLRDNALVKELRALGHDAVMVPLYLPPKLDEADMSRGRPVFFGGINVALQHVIPFLRKVPRWLDAPLSWRWVLSIASVMAGMTRASGHGSMAVSMLKGEEGRQAKEFDRLVDWLGRKERPEIVLLSNALLVGAARPLRERLKVPVVCNMQGEDGFIDGLDEASAKEAWALIGQQAAHVEKFVAVSQFCAAVMRRRAGLPASKVTVVRNGINLEGYDRIRPPVADASVGYLARMCPDKGLEILVDAFIEVKRTDRIPGLRLKVAGAMTPADRPFVGRMKRRLASRGLMRSVDFLPNPDRRQKQEFLRSLRVFSVPVISGEAFGLYVLEALATGVPVVQPREGPFPEIIEATGGGILVEPGNSKALAQGLEEVLIDPRKGRILGQRGREAVFREFSSRRMAEGMLEVFREALAVARK
ncbi:MAG TPA: glycosyltransferase family 4 protein [Verrucomicrobiae bacterium]|nr:glycosyltransferase family 4 protein [Verrucomicrobiae bacterium]